MTRRPWLCEVCRGLFAYPADSTPNFCPYCRAAISPCMESEMSSFKFHLGVHVTTKIEQFKGCIVSRMDSITGCNRYCLQPEVGADGKFIDSVWTDEHNLEIDSSKQQIKLYRDADQPPG